MSQAKPATQHVGQKLSAGIAFPAPGADADNADAEALLQSSTVNDAMQTTAKLWSRTAHPWLGDEMDCALPKYGKDVEQCASRQRAAANRKRNSKPRTIQARAYIHWKEAYVQSWLQRLKEEADAPNETQLEFL